MAVYASWRDSRRHKANSCPELPRKARMHELQSRREQEHFCALGRTLRVDTKQFTEISGLLPQITQTDIAAPQRVIQPNSAVELITRMRMRNNGGEF